MRACLSSAEREKLLAGGLTLEEKRACDEHVSYCESCRESLARTEADRNLFEKLRRAYRSPGVSQDGREGDPVGPVSLEEGRLVGRFRLLREIGRGGMGVVFLGEDVSLNRRVALKILPLHLTLSPQRLERFRREALAAAKLRHPNIVAVHEVGEDRGLHFFVMDCIEGPSLAQWIEERRGSGSGATEKGGAVHGGAGPSDFAATARIGLAVAEALAYAHEQGIIHRDVKPSNILLDAGGTPWVADFGLAKDIGAESLSLTGDLLGTPAYMPPEQLRTDPPRADSRSDIYSLGVTLYEAIALRPPFPAASGQELIQRILTSDPPPLGKVDPRVPRDLETIVMQAMDKEPGRRYQSAVELAADLKRYIEHRPVKARPLGPISRAARLVRRKPAGAAAVVLALTLVAGGPLFIAVSERNKSRSIGVERDKAVAAQRQAAESLSRLFLEKAATARERTEHQRAALFAAASIEQKDTPAARGELYRARAGSIGGLLWGAGNPPPVVEALEFDAGGDRLVCKSQDGTVRVFEFPAGRETVVLRDEAARIVAESAVRRPVALHPHGAFLAFAMPAGGIELRDASTGEALARLEANSGPVRGVAISPDDRWVASSTESGGVRILAADDGALAASLPASEGRPISIAFQPQGELLASGGVDGKIRLWRTADWKLAGVLEGHTSEVEGLSFSPDGLRLASGSRDKTVRLWDVPAGKEMARHEGHESLVRSVAFSPDGTRVGSGSSNATVAIWKPGSAPSVLRFPMHANRVFAVAFHPQGGCLAAASVGGTIRFIDPDTGSEKDSLAAGIELSRAIAYSPDGRTLAACCSDGSIRFWDLRIRSEIGRLEAHEASVGALAFSRDGSRLASGGWDGRLHVWSIRGQGPAAVLDGRKAGVHSIGFSPDGSRLAMACLDGAIEVWDVEARKPVALLEGHSQEVISITFSSDGKKLASGSRDHTARLWDIESRRELLRAPSSLSRVWSVALSPDGSRLAAGGGDGGLAVWDISRGQLAWWTKADRNAVHAVVIHADGTTLFTGGDEGIVRAWDSKSGQKRRELPAEGGGIASLALSFDGTLLAAATDAGHAIVWELGSGSIRLRLPAGPTRIWTVAFSLDGSWIATASEDKIVRIWSAATGEELAKLEGHMRRANSVAFRPGKREIATAATDSRVLLWDLEILQRSFAEPQEGILGRVGEETGLYWTEEGVGRRSPSGFTWLIEPERRRKLLGY